MERYRPNRIAAKVRGRPFKKGYTRSPGAGRKKGSRNKITINAKIALEGSAEDIGELRPVWSRYKKDGTPVQGAFVLRWEPTGIDGLRGYFRSLALIRPSAYASLWAKILPTQINATLEGDMTVTSRFAGMDLAKMPLQEKIALYREAVGLTKQLPADQKLIDVSPGRTTVEQPAIQPVQASQPSSMSEKEEKVEAEAEAELPGDIKAA